MSAFGGYWAAHKRAESEAKSRREDLILETESRQNMVWIERQADDWVSQVRTIRTTMADVLDVRYRLHTAILNGALDVAQGKSENDAIIERQIPSLEVEYSSALRAVGRLRAATPDGPLIESFSELYQIIREELLKSRDAIDKWDPSNKDPAAEVSQFFSGGATSSTINDIIKKVNIRLGEISAPSAQNWRKASDPRPNQAGPTTP